MSQPALCLASFRCSCGLSPTCGPDYIVAAYDSPGPTYRHVAYKKYKAQRAKTDDALVAQLIKSREVLDAFGIPHYEAPGFEADDVIGTVVEKMSNM